MVRIHPFSALRPPTETAAQVAAVPYDVVNTEEAAALAHGNPLSFLHVTRSEISFTEPVDPHADIVYTRAAENFASLIKACPLKEDAPGLYLYQQRMGAHVQTGLVACCAIDEYDTDVIKKHERTRRDKEDDRTKHLLTLRAQTGLVFLTYRGTDVVDRTVARLVQQAPIYNFDAADGIGHTMWTVPAADVTVLVEAFGGVKNLYVADGHHRLASASRARDALRDANPQHTGQEEYNFVLAVLFPASQLRIMAYNRVVHDLAGRSPDEFLAAVREKFDVVEGAEPTPARGEYSMYLRGRWFGLIPRPESLAALRHDPVAMLGVSVLQSLLLDPILNIKDVRTDKRIDFVGGIRGTAELVRLVDGGAAAVAFSLAPTTMDELMAVSDAGEMMPPKSTWFEPKLRDGLVTHCI